MIAAILIIVILMFIGIGLGLIALGCRLGEIHKSYVALIEDVEAMHTHTKGGLGRIYELIGEVQHDVLGIDALICASFWKNAIKNARKLQQTEGEEAADE